MKKNLLSPGQIKIAVSLHPEIFYALQVLFGAKSRAHSEWKYRTLSRLPERCHAFFPAGLWPALADSISIQPTTDFSVLIDALKGVPNRQFQERILRGVLHNASVTDDLLERKLGLTQALRKLPKAKREWLAYIDLYPLDSEAPAWRALEQLIDSPEAFRVNLIEVLQMFWDSSFRQTWETLLPAFAASADAKKVLRSSGTFEDFLRHTLLPVEIVGGGSRLRAIRGGYELALADIEHCTFTPSIFNHRRHWTVYEEGERSLPWFPYFDPDLAPEGELCSRERSDPEESSLDIELILRALGDTTRFTMVKALGKLPRTSAELAIMLAVSKPTISHHIQLLRFSGLIHETDQGNGVLISLKRPVFEKISSLTITRIFDSAEPLKLTKSRRKS